MADLVIKYLPTDDLIPYANNPRRNDAAVDKVAASIKEFGFRVPIVLDADNVIVAGHTRLKAAKKLGLKKVPCVIADDLTEDQIKAYRLADNKVSELAEWDFELLDIELDDIDLDMSQFGFEDGLADWFSEESHGGNNTEGETDEYKEFVEKFEAKKTTDDCYTPSEVYDAVADWVAEEYKLDRARFVRPFYPGGDYQSEKYKDGDIVVDNPPFSILAEIIRFYCEKGIKFFLFAPALTLFTGAESPVEYIPLGVGVTYENGACVSTSFIDNIGEYRVRTAPELYKAVKDADDRVRSEMKRELPKYSFPDCLITAAGVQRFSKYGIDFRLSRESVGDKIAQLDAMKDTEKAIYGGGFLISSKAAAEKAAAEKAAAEKAAAHRWQLSPREEAIVASLG